MKAIQANLTFFVDEASNREVELRQRLEKLLQTAFGDSKDWELRWLDDEPSSGAGYEKLASKLERLDT